MRSGGGSSGHIGMYVGEDGWMHLSTYDDHTPILDISAGSTTVAISVTDRKAGEAALEFARELATKAALYAAEVERLHTQHSQDSATSDGGSAGNGEAA
jgi:hypothetical protein